MRLRPGLMLGLLLATTASATPWYVTWTGDAYPESEGWSHFASDPPAQRWLEDGKLFIDSRADWYIYDSYAQLRPGEMALAPGEKLDVRWRVKVDEVIPTDGTDPAVFVRSDDYYILTFALGVDRIDSLPEPGHWAPFAPHEFHEFAVESWDMRSYSLYIDGALAIEGEFFQGFPGTPGFSWGDMTSFRSLVEWDWLEGGIVPEPSAGLESLLAFCTACSRRRSAARAKKRFGEGDMT